MTKHTLANASQAYDSHMNLVLGDVLETIYVVDDEDDDSEEIRVSAVCLSAFCSVGC
jgi:small nuclear ribonucleoprotein (snRNP)-like protein